MLGPRRGFQEGERTDGGLEGTWAPFCKGRRVCQNRGGLVLQGPCSKVVTSVSHLSFS